MYKSKSKKTSAGFYIALAICIVTVAAAAWTTCGSITEYYQPQEMHTGNEVSGEPYELSEPSPAASASSVPEPSAAPVRQEPSAAEEPAAENPSPEPSAGSAEDSAAPSEESAEAVRTVICPIESGTVLKPFSRQKLLYARTTNDWRTHRGTDYAAQAGTSVLAMMDGVVQSVYQDALYGYCICIDHDKCIARYCGLTEKVLVHEGDHVSSGQPIGYIGTVPCEQSDEAHLHLELTVGSHYVSLEQLVSK